MRFDMRLNRVTTVLTALIAIQIIFFAVAITGEQEARWQEASNTASRMVNVALSITDDFFNRYFSIFEALKSVDAFANQAPEPSGTILKRLKDKHSEIVNFAAVKSNGYFFASSMPMSTPPPNIKHLEFFQRIQTGDKHVIMNPHKGPISKELVTGLAVPLENPSSRMNGLIGVSIKYKALTDHWNNFLSKSGIMMAVYDSKGQTIHLSEGFKIPDPGFITGMPSGKLEEVRINHESFVFTTVRHMNSGWRFSLFVPIHGGLTDLLSARKDILFLIGLIVITIFTLVIWLKQEHLWTVTLNENREQIAQTEDKFRQLAENISAVFWISSPDKNSLIYVSPGFERMWGIDPKELDANPWRWLDSVHPEDRARIRDAVMLKQKEGTYNEQYRIRDKDGNIRWIHDRAFPLKDESGEVYRIVGIAEDVTSRIAMEEALRRSEEELRAVVDHSVDAIGVSKKGIHTFVNNAYLKMFGYPDASELIGKPILSLIAPDERERITRYITERSKGLPLLNKYETKGFRKNGTVFDMEVNVAQYGPEGDQNTLVILRDVTERNIIEEKLRQSQKMDAIGSIAGGIAHDFNNILFPIIGIAELLAEDLRPESPEYENVQEILTAGKRGIELVKRILSFSRRTEAVMTPVSVQKILSEVLKLCRATIPANIGIEQDIHNDCRNVWADPTQLHQVCLNLITNAYHAIQHDNGLIRIELKEIHLEKGSPQDFPESSGHYLQLSVTDNGEGMTQDVMGRIFEPFFTTKEQGKGTGLGLSVVYSIVKECRGDIRVHSEPGKGSVFKILLPLIDAREESSNLNQKVNVETGTERILLVDDEESIVKLLHQILTRLGYKVTAKQNGTEALKAFRDNPDDFDLVITDMTMPEMTGEHLSREILSVKPGMPIIICTGFSEKMDTEQAKAMGVKGFLMKPVKKADLGRVIRQVFDSP
jgi:PAS domain S-box-containing protein